METCVSADVDCLIVGAGIVGLAIARELSRAGRDVIVVDQHAQVGAETSSRNSEVIHAGLYYPPASLKARFCIEGKALLYAFAAENGILAKRRGKLLVATTPAEIPKLAAIAANAKTSGVDDLVQLSPAEARAREPEITCAAAYLSPSTGVIDTHALMLALEGHVQAGGGEIVLSTRVTGIKHSNGLFRVDLADSSDADSANQSGESFTCRSLVLAAGLHTTALARPMFANNQCPTKGAHPRAYTPPETYYAKGHYFTLSGRSPFTHLIYPMPRDGGLGVHLTLDIAGDAKFGPDVTWVDRITYEFDDPDGSRRTTFIDEIRRWWPGLHANALHPGYTGMRPKLSRKGEPAADFAIHGPDIHGCEGLVALYGIESPGLTSALAIARHVAPQLQQR